MSKRERLADYNDHSWSKFSGCLALVKSATCHLCYPWQLAQVRVNHEEGRYMVGYLRAVTWWENFNILKYEVVWSVIVWPLLIYVRRRFSMEKTAMFVGNDAFQGESWLVLDFWIINRIISVKHTRPIWIWTVHLRTEKLLRTMCTEVLDTTTAQSTSQCGSMYI